MNKLYIEDNGIGKVVIKLNGQDITSGVQSYQIDRSVDDFVIFSVVMRVIPEEIKIKKENSESSND